MPRTTEGCAKHFQIQSEVDLDFVIGQRTGLPVGMSRRSSPEFRRRVLAALVSYQAGLKSIDYALRRYVDPDLYEEDDGAWGDATSDYLRDCSQILQEELRKLHTVETVAFGVFGAEITIYRIPYALDTARLLSNRGLLLETLPILRLCLEMMAWAGVAFRLHDDQKIVELKAQSCITQLKAVYEPVGKLYGYLSKFSHWGHAVHAQFLDISELQVAVLMASVRYRAITLALCLAVVDVFVEVIRDIYAEKAEALILRVQESLLCDENRRTKQYLAKIVELSSLDELQEIRQLFK